MNEAQPTPRSAAANLSGVAGALLAASCCLLPLALILSGVAGAGIMMTMMRYEWITLPLGVSLVVGAWWLYVHDQKRCSTAGCELVGKRFRLSVLSVATLVVFVALLLKLFPAWTASLLQSL
ncbi:MAG: hypothetical protein GKS06_13620 [Acidobacteria bacterium]|nr:hypothetical protein [Acidobacteriota bacterium]